MDMRTEEADDIRAWRPVILDAASPEGRSQLGELRSSGLVWRVHDVIDAQLRDLADARIPEKEPPTQADIDDGVRAILAGVATEDFGRWVHYPWSGRLVHLLPPDMFEELRLNRNRNKITPDEQRLLRRATIGIVGLSVGNAIALTLALEGSFGHLKIADFDVLDLSNMNRLRAGVHELRLPKTVLAARQIFEIDPYAQVSIYPDGLTAENIDEFLGGDPPLDVLIDECDSIALKFLLRERARERGLPVLMETSDRGMLDIERFDLEPDRPLFHGLTGDLSSADLAAVDGKDRTSRDRKAVVAIKILDGANISARMAASMVEVDQTLSTWPQLASDVTLGGASTAVAVRRLVLGQPLESGRRYVDLQRTVESGHLTPPPPPEGSERPKPLPAPGYARASGVPDVPEIVRLAVEHAVLAPSGGNTQPWHFWFDGDRLWVVNDRVRARNLFDQRRRASYLALGAAVENMAVAAAHEGHATEVEAFPIPEEPDIVAAVRFEPRTSSELTSLASSFPLLRRRMTNRRLSERAMFTEEEAVRLVRAAQSRGADVKLATDGATMDEVARILGAADRIRFLALETHAEVMGELRWSRTDAESSGDGLTVTSLELTPAGEAALAVLSRPDIAAQLRAWNVGGRLEEGARDSIAAASAVGVLELPDDEPGTWLSGGRALQQTWLAATEIGLAFQPMTVLLFMFELLDATPSPFNDLERATLTDLQQRLNAALGLDPKRPAAMLFRLARAPEPEERSLRLPVGSVLERGEPPRSSVRATAVEER